jgi:bla regulator protein BlaR1
MDIVKEVILLEETEEYAYRGKTGSCVPEEEQPLGWFIGYVERDDETYIFATNVQAAEASGQQARRITEDILRHLTVIP